MNALVLAIHVQLGKHDNVLGVTSPVRDPVLLRQRGRGVDDQLVRFFVVGGGGLHLDGVVAVAQLSQAEAANVGQLVDAWRKLSDCVRSRHFVH